MPTARSARRDICVVLHDVAPARWAGCTRVLGQLKAVSRRAGADLPLTLLVVPSWHGHDGVPPLYRRWLLGQVRDGHELALHGYRHLDESPEPRGMLDWVQRRVWTDGEGEFAVLDRDAALDRLAAARGWAQGLDLPVSGFVPPGWLASPAALEAIGMAGFDYTCSFTRLIAFPGARPLRCPGLGVSVRSPWRRQLSRWLLPPLAQVIREAPLLRLDLHPDDADWPDVRDRWGAWLEAALRERRPLLLRDASRLAPAAPGSSVAAA